ncbi:uncharacterized protein LOC127850513 isoform X2 [Dreissena polymorpha]|uniref:uncharacterized protein LOC127850513 isoform X2 n=1 Tax=Dreissena polymorpha TaxID=45954 RepID=UPI002264FFD1|nr:uncharacterized protein LOC127850513 isoform X2 [Dreissena polymorpha]
MGDKNIVENWLKSIELEKYTEHFIDNGYDDLEICKQIGAEDLDAINVDDADKDKILNAVRELKEKGGCGVYLTLENEQTSNARDTRAHVPIRPTLDNLLSDVPPPTPDDGVTNGSQYTVNGGQSLGVYDVQHNIVIYPKYHLTLILRDKVFEDHVDLASPPYTAQNLAPCWSSLTALAIKYATDLSTPVEDVLDRLEDIRWWQVTQDSVSVYSPGSMTSSAMEDPYYLSTQYAGSPRTGPPPIPSVPPPEMSHMDRYGQLHSIQTRYQDSPSHANYVSLDTGECESPSEKKKTSTLGRLFRNMGFRRSSRKHSYKKHQGDLLAHEITMSDNDRIALMQMVKEGKISTETALQVVKKFEEERKREEPPQDLIGKDKKSSKSKKSQSLKPTKSPSINYTESTCDSCNSSVFGNFAAGYPDGTQCRACQEEGCRHRRVHSVSHIAYPNQLHSPGAGRAMSCSPMRANSNQASAVNSPIGYMTKQGSNIYTPVIPHELKMYTGAKGLYAVHGIEMIKDRLSVIKTSGCVHKTQSKASLISSESDHSMECSAMMSGQQPEDMYFPSNTSNVSVGSDTLPGMNGRRKCGSTMEKMRNHKWARTGSSGQAEDGMLTDTDDQDAPDRLLLGGGTAGSNMMEKFRGVGKEMRKRILHTRDIIGDGKSQHLCSAYQSVQGSSLSAGSADSSSSGVGSQSSAPAGDPEFVGSFSGHVLGMARVHSNYVPSAEEKDFLHLKIGERVQVLEATSSGIWKGRVDTRVGFFHFNFVDMITDSTPVCQRKEKSRRRTNRRSKPRSVEELLSRIGLEHLAPLFLMNGFDSLEIFAEIDHNDLNALNVLDSESRTKLITAAELLTDVDDHPPEGPGRTCRSTTATPTSQQYAVPWTSFFPSTKASGGSRDSGCYDSSEYGSRENPNRDQESLAGMYARNRGAVAGGDNKENLKPLPVTLKRVVPPVQNGGVSSAESLSVNGARNVQEERVYSEEDKEVCNLTGCLGLKVRRASPQSTNLVNGHGGNQGRGGSSDVHSNYRCLNIPTLGSDWKVFSDCCSQTSPYGPLNESDDAAQLFTGYQSLSEFNSGVVALQNELTKLKFRPYVRKMAPVVPTNDAQVQVMCPLGNLLQSPTSPPITSSAKSQNQSKSEKVINQTTIAQTGSPMVLTKGKTLKQRSDSVKNTTKIEFSEPTRVSYTSQSSREGDSGSDASTVKSESEQGRNTPDSIYGPIHAHFKSIKRSVIPKVTSKLALENIDLASEPYSSATGACGIPPLLVQRYAEELKQDLFKTALILDQVRIHKLTSLGRPVIPAEQLSENSLASSELKISSVPDFFISIGLPMYADSITAKGHNSVDALSSLTIKEIQMITKADRKHLKRIIHALEWVQSRLRSPSRKTKPSPVKDKV